MPDNILDIFNDNAFGVVEMTEAVNMIPPSFGRIGQLGIFPEKGITTTDVAIDIKEGVLNLVPTSPRGTAPTPNLRGGRSLKKFSVPRLALEDSVKPTDIQGVRAFGGGGVLATAMDAVAEVQIDMVSKIDQTIEFFRNGALNGIVMDSDGTELLNLYTEFGIEQKTINFKLNVDGENLTDKINNAKRHVVLNIKGDNMNGLRFLCSPEFWDMFITHPKVEKAYELYQGTDNPLRNDVRGGFAFQSAIWEEYLGQASFYDPATKTSTTKKFIPEGSALVVPMGTFRTFRTFLSPAEWLETVNTRGRRLYSKLARPAKYNEKQDVTVHSYPLPICLRPAVLIEATAE